MPTTESIFRRNRTLIFFILGLIIVFCLLYALRSAIFPFLLGIVLVYLVKPLISWVEGKLPYKGKLLRTKRISLIIFFFIVFLGLVGLLFFYLVTAVADSFSGLIINAPEYISEGLYALQEWVESLRYQFSPEIQQQIGDYINNIGSTLGNAVQASFMKGLSFIPTTISFVLAFISLPIFRKTTNRIRQNISSAVIHSNTANLFVKHVIDCNHTNRLHMNIAQIFNSG